MCLCGGPFCGKLHLSLKPGKLVFFILVLGAYQCVPPTTVAAGLSIKSDLRRAGLKRKGRLDSCWDPCVAESTSPEACLSTGCPFV